MKPERRGVVISFRLTEEEYNSVIEENKDIYGKNISEYFRNLVMQPINNKKNYKLFCHELKKIKTEIHHARLLYEKNFTKSNENAAKDELKESIQNCEKLLKQIKSS